VTRANVLIASGHRDEAIALLDLRVREAPGDSLARQTLLSARVAALEEEIRNILSIESKNKELVVGDADYEASRSRADTAVMKRLDIAEYYAQNNRYPEAVVTCNAILKDYPHHPAALKLKFRVLQTMIEKERAELDKERDLRHEDAINDVIDAGLLPGRMPKARREIFVFDEDIADADRHNVQLKLQQKVDLIYDGTNGTKSTQVREILQPLFAIAGISYVILDSALGTETLTIHLVGETIENALLTISRLVNIRYNYSGGTVYISSATSDVLVTEIIRVQSGLTDVLTEPKFQDMQGAPAPPPLPVAPTAPTASTASPRQSTASMALAARAVPMAPLAAAAARGKRRTTRTTSRWSATSSASSTRSPISWSAGRPMARSTSTRSRTPSTSARRRPPSPRSSASSMPSTTIAPRC
jgi:hypothetical protein